MTQFKVSAETLRDKPLVRWTVLILMALTMFFAYMFVDVLSPLKTMLENSETYNWSSSVFGTYGGSEFLLNVFFFFLIFAGIILDKMGIRFTAILSGSLMLIGALIKVYALSSYFNNGGFGYSFFSSFWSNFPASAKLACIGFAIFGSGCEMGGVTVSRAIVKWFKGKELALAMGLEMAIARLGASAVFWTSPYLANRYGNVQAPVIFVLVLLFIGLLLYFIYGIFDKKLDAQNKLDVDFVEDEPFKFSDLKYVVCNKMFWIVALLCVMFYSAIFPFQKFATEMLQSNIGFTEETAAKIFSIFPFGAMCITPFLGAFLDRVGKGATMLMVGSILMFLSHLIFAIYPFQTGTTSATVIALIAIVVLGISFSLVPAALWPSVPKLIDERVLGSAYSAIFWIQNIGLMTVPMLIGTILDKTNTTTPVGEPKNYTVAMLVFASFGIFAFVLSLILKAEDKRKNYGLELPNASDK